MIFPRRLFSRSQLVAYLINLPRWQKRLICVLTDIFFVTFALWFAFVLRLGYDVVRSQNLCLFLVLAPLVSIPIFIRLGLYRAIIRYIGSEAFKTIIHAITLSALFLTLFFFWLQEEHNALIPRSVVVIYWLLSILFVGGMRFSVRNFINRDAGLRGLFLPAVANSKPHAAPVVVYGAGAAGFELMGSLSRSKEFLPIAFLDDNPEIQGRVMSGYPIVSPALLPRLIEQHRIRYVLLAMPSVPRSRKQKIIDHLEILNVHVKTLPSVNELAEGKVAIQDIQDIDIADLLGRDPVAPLPHLLSRCILGKNVLVTGAGGSIGSELCRQILRQRPKTLVLFDHSEFALYKTERELQHVRTREALRTQIVPVLGSVCAWGRICAALQRFQINTLYHAAAYKHVPLVEQNMAEGIRNNVFGTLVTAQAALVSNVEHFILISTDKAVRPTSIMGASKRMAEMVLQALSKVENLQTPVLIPEEDAQNAPNHTCFSMVRFGNVLGSSGSVIPLFRKQIEAGGPVTVTDPRVIRYFMTIPEASELVIQAGAMAKGGEVFLLDMGAPISILTLARRMILLSGRTIRDTENPSGDIEIVFSGLRSGEKLYEELLIGTQDKQGTIHPKIFYAHETSPSWEDVLKIVHEIHQAMQNCWPHGAPESCDCKKIRETLMSIEGYRPQCGIVDVIWQEEKSLR